MRQRKLSFLFLLTMTIALFLGVFGGYLLLQSETYLCSVKEMLLEPDMMPNGWEFEWYILPPVLSKDGASDAMSIYMTYNNELAHHTVYIFRNNLEAILFYLANSLDFNPSDFSQTPRIQWTEIKGSDQWELSGDATSVKCMTGKDQFINGLCVAVVRYGSVVSEFYAQTNNEGMNEKEFMDTVIAIDKRISSCRK